MKLALILADSASPDAKGTVSALGLGATTLTVDRMPAQFHGALVLVATPESDDPTGELRFSLTLKVPNQEQPIQFAFGAFVVADPRRQVVMTSPFDLLIVVDGEYVFRAALANSVAEARLSVEMHGASRSSTQPTPADERKRE